MNGTPDGRARATQPATLDLTHCPACSAPAEIVGRFVLESTEGPIEHVRVHCVEREWFVIPVSTLAAATTR